MRSRIGKTGPSRDEEFLTCEQVITFLLDYLERALPADESREFARHLAICPSCAAYLATYEQTIHLGRETLRRELEADPPPLGGELMRAILESRP